RDLHSFPTRRSSDLSDSMRTDIRKSQREFKKQNPVKTFSVVACVGLILILFQLAAAQQSKVYQVGVLGPPGKVEDFPAIKGLREGLKVAGYIEGKNLQIAFPNVTTYDELRLL